MAEFDQYRDNYQMLINDALKFSGATQQFFTMQKAELLTPLLADLAPSDRPIRVLDVGCGHGLVHPMLKAPQMGLSLTGVDVANDVIEWARAHQPNFSYQVYDGTKLPFEDGCFDLAYTICVMHHVPPAAWSSFISEMRRVVRPGGAIVVIEHNPLNPVTQYIVRTCPIDENAVLLHRGRLAALMREAGLDSVDTRYLIFTPFQNGPARKIDRLLAKVPFGAQYIMTARVPDPTATGSMDLGGIAG